MPAKAPLARRSLLSTLLPSLLTVALAPLAAHAAPSAVPSAVPSTAPSYVVTPLGGLGGSSGDVSAINNAGVVVGYALSPGSVRNAFSSSGPLTANLHPPGAAGSRAFGINDFGVAAGVVDENGAGRAATFARGAVNRLGTLGGANSVANAINVNGVVVGAADLADGGQHAFRYTPGAGMFDLGSLGGPNSSATDINAGGAVVGLSDTGSGGYHAFLHRDGGMRDLGTLGGHFSEASGINDAGAISGFSYIGGDAYAHAFIHAGGGMRDLLTLGGLNSYSYGINNLGQAVGSSEIAGSNALHAFVYADGVMTDLNTLVDPRFGWTLNYAADINDRGQIAAFGCNSASDCQGFLLTLRDVVTPIPEPSTYAMLLLGLGLLGWQGWRRRPAGMAV